MNRTTVYCGALAALVGVLAVACLEATTSAPSESQGIGVRGAGKVSTTPDLARLLVGVRAQASSVSLAREQAAEAMTDLLDSIQANGVADEDIQTTQFTIRSGLGPECQQPPPIALSGQPVEQVSFCLENTVLVKVRDLDTVGTIVDDAVEAAGDLVQIQGVQFSLEDPSDLLDQAEEMAVKDAREKAQRLAQRMGVGLGPVIRVTTFESPPSVGFGLGGGIMLPATGPGISTPVEVGLFDVVVTVEATFAIE